MNIIANKVPYDFTVRWRDGQVAGAHFIWLYQTVEQGVVVGQHLSPALPVSVAQEEGFPLSDILSDVTRDALAALSKATADLEAARMELADERARVAALSEALVAAQAARQDGDGRPAIGA